MTNPTSVVRLDPAQVTDRYGDTVPDWDTVTETVIQDAVIAPEYHPEETDAGRRGVVFAWSMWIINQTVALDAQDRVRYDGNTYEVEGTPARWIHPRTGRLVTHAPLRRVEG